MSKRLDIEECKKEFYEWYDYRINDPDQIGGYVWACDYGRWLIEQAEMLNNCEQLAKQTGEKIPSAMFGALSLTKELDQAQARIKELELIEEKYHEQAAWNQEE